MPTTLDRLVAAAAHLAALVGLPIVLPALIYVWKRDERFVADHARQALGMQLVLCTTGVAMVGAVVVDVPWLTPLAMAIDALLVLLTVVCSVRATLCVLEGRRYRYPLLGRLFARS
jgi:uncharacterized Tic20 family protein